ncbi:hypothetical protein BN12_1510014 [Nostocoides japonicum T1-X7]|uniref:Uncharacterized protein n=1 Tax=Nostocoides japonicum T1-X7 TaxID=1194083 RepID=A0A077LU00_9MICO|nr:hypothetical protein [Tetrasphaera japonica]CCH76901.1 hypothetical protein BN12_1510014 [Tetrasphaera japonica T1-X7]
MPNSLSRSTKQRCLATLSDGSAQCPNYAIVGATVCTAHTSPGGVRTAARRRLASLVPEAVERLGHEMRTAEKPSDRIRAATAIVKYGAGPSEVSLDEAKALLIERVRALVVPPRELPSAGEVDDIL